MSVDFLTAVARASLNRAPGRLQWPGGSGVVDAASRHGVLAQLHALLPSIDAVPDDARAAVREAMRDATRRMLGMTAQLRAAVDAITAAGVEVLPVKGPMLAHILYGHPAGRGALSDLDLVVRPADFRRAMDALAAVGYERREILHDEHDHDWDDEANLVPIRGGWPARLELHSILGGGAGMLPMNVDAVLARSSTQPFAGTMMRSAASGDTLLYLCVHGSQHMFSRLQWVCDVAQFLRVEPELDWKAIIAAADAVHARRPLALGLYLARELFGVAPPAQAEVLFRDRALRRLARLVRGQMQMLADDRAPSRLFSLRCRLAVRETTGQRTALLLSLFRPNVADRTLMPLSGGLRWLSVVVRPIRIAGASLRRRMRR